MSYRVDLTEQALEDVQRVPQNHLRSIHRHIDALVTDPRPPGVVALRGYPPNNYRVRAGDYRIGYEIDDQNRVVTVWQVGNRKHFYQKAKRRR